MTDTAQSGERRSTVSVVMPFSGDEQAARAALARIGAIRLDKRDEAILVDNSIGQVTQSIPASLKEGVTTVVARDERSSYYARNVGAEAASGDWILFIDADCVPPPNLIEKYMGTPIDEGVGMLAGPIHPADGQPGLLPEWAATRGILDQSAGLSAEVPAAATANVLVKGEAFRALGGFQEGIRSGGDHEFSWRLTDAGWKVRGRPEAGVEHVHRTSISGIARQMARYAAGNAWQRRKRPEVSHDEYRLTAAFRSLAGAFAFGLTLRPRRAALKAVDVVAQSAQAGGALLSNSVRPPILADPRRIVVATDRFPVRSETFVTGEIAGVRSLGRSVRVEAVERPDSPSTPRPGDWTSDIWKTKARLPDYVHLCGPSLTTLFARLRIAGTDARLRTSGCPSRRSRRWRGGCLVEGSATCMCTSQHSPPSTRSGRRGLRAAP